MEYLHTDASSGLSYYTATEPVTGKTIIRSQQDVAPVLDEAARRRNSGSGDNKIAEHIRHYCMLPNSVQLELYKKGINMFRPDESDWKRFFKEVETNYPHLKVTNKKVWQPK